MNRGLSWAVALFATASLALLAWHHQHQVQLMSVPMIGDAMIDGDMKKAFSKLPASYRAVENELHGYALDTEELRNKAEGQAPLDAAQTRAVSELKSYEVLNFRDKNAHQAGPRRGEGSRYEGDRESQELHSYENILGVSSKAENLKKHNKMSASSELSAYQNILGFETTETHKPGKKLRQQKIHSDELGAYNVLTFPSEQVGIRKSIKTYAGTVKRMKSKAAAGAHKKDELESPSSPVLIRSHSAKTQEEMHNLNTLTKSSISHLKLSQRRVHPVSHSSTRAVSKVTSPKLHTTKLFELNADSESSGHPLWKSWIKLWNLNHHIKKSMVNVDHGRTEKIVSDLMEVKHAIVKEARDGESVQQHDGGLLRRDLKGIEDELVELAPGVMASERQKEKDLQRCRQCLKHWSRTALQCAEKSCHEDLSADEREQLSINNDIASAFGACVGPLDDKTSRVRAVVKDFVLPAKALPRLHEWALVSPADSGILGLGLETGHSKRLDMGSSIYLSAIATKCGDSSQTLAQRLAPLAARQKELNLRVDQRQTSELAEAQSSRQPWDAISPHADTAEMPHAVAAVISWRSAAATSELELVPSRATAPVTWEQFVDVGVAGEAVASPTAYRPSSHPVQLHAPPQQQPKVHEAKPNAFDEISELKSELRATQDVLSRTLKANEELEQNVADLKSRRAQASQLSSTSGAVPQDGGLSAAEIKHEELLDSIHKLVDQLEHTDTPTASAIHHHKAESISMGQGVVQDAQEAARRAADQELEKAYARHKQLLAEVARLQSDIDRPLATVHRDRTSTPLALPARKQRLALVSNPIMLAQPIGAAQSSAVSTPPQQSTGEVLAAERDIARLLVKAKSTIESQHSTALPAAQRKIFRRRRRDLRRSIERAEARLAERLLLSSLGGVGARDEVLQELLRRARGAARRLRRVDTASAIQGVSQELRAAMTDAQGLPSSASIVHKRPSVAALPVAHPAAALRAANSQAAAGKVPQAAPVVEVAKDDVKHLIGTSGHALTATAAHTPIVATSEQAKPHETLKIRKSRRTVRVAIRGDEKALKASMGAQRRAAHDVQRELDSADGSARAFRRILGRQSSAAAAAQRLATRQEKAQADGLRFIPGIGYVPRPEKEGLLEQHWVPIKRLIKAPQHTMQSGHAVVASVASHKGNGRKLN